MGGNHSGRDVSLQMPRWSAWDALTQEGRLSIL